MHNLLTPQFFSLTPQQRRGVLAMLAMGVLSLSMSVSNSASANPIVRQRMADGSVLYTDAPVQGLKVERTIVVPPSVAGSPWMANPGLPNLPNLPSSKAASEKRVAPASRATSDASDIASKPNLSQKSTTPPAEMPWELAKEKLATALENKLRGEAPEEGERTRNANGTSRLNEAYELRQNKLNKAVEAAKSAVEKAH